MTYDRPDDKDPLVSELISGNPDAFSRLYDAYGSILFGVIFRIVNDRQDAENLLQDCFIKIWQNANRYDANKGRLATWLINIARNTAIDFTRSKFFSQKRRNQSLDNLVSREMHFASYARIEDYGLKQILNRLSPVCREIIVWMYYEGYTQQEISDQFSIPLGTVKSRTRKAMKELRQILSS